jgi:hypothetical protein
MGQYKFLESQYINDLLEGKIFSGRLIYYRLLEIVEQNRWIGDKSEGVAVTTADNLCVSPDAPNPALRKKLEEDHITHIGEGASFSMTNSKFICENDCFVFCFSSGDLKQLTETMCDAPPDPECAYDGCVSIVDPLALAKAIYDSGQLDGKLIRDNFSISPPKLVNYETAVERDYLKGGIAPADPFKKDLLYKPQQEMRIVLTPHHPIEGDSITITVDNPDALFREEFRDRPIGMKANRPHDERKPAELKKVLSDALQIWDDFPGHIGDERTIAFDSHRAEIVQAYWKLRKTYPDAKLDGAFARSDQACHVCNRLRAYLSRIRYAELTGSDSLQGIARR